MKDARRFRLQAIALATLVFVHTGATIGCGAAFYHPPKTKTIPLTSVFVTGEQKGLKLAVLDEKQPFQHHLEFFQRLSPVASNVFLASAENLNEAIGAGLRFN